MAITSSPERMMGKPTIAGTRITVESILERMGAGESEAQIIEANPRLTRQDIRDALRFAAKAMQADVLYPIDADAA
jgi:uncharacterized protein (DUF433 family)